MVDIFLEYGYYIVGAIASGAAAIGVILSVKKYTRDLKLEQERTLNTKITEGVNQVIKHIDTKTEIINQRFVTSDIKQSKNESDIEDINEDVKVLEKDFKSLCEKIGKHDYIVEKILPEYIDLKDSIYNFKSKIDQNLLSNNQPVTRNTEHDKGEEGLK